MPFCLSALTMLKLSEVYLLTAKNSMGLVRKPAKAPAKKEDIATSIFE